MAMNENNLVAKIEFEQTNKTGKMKNILVACDFSEEANCACRFAIEFGAVSGAKVLLISIVELDGADGLTMSNQTYWSQVAFLSKLMEKAENDFDNFRHSLSVSHDHVSFSVEVGALKDCLLKIIREHSIDLVLVGISRKAEVKEFLTESKFRTTVLAA